MSAGTLLSRHPMANGLVLELWNGSRPVAGDRWLVSLEARIAVPVEPGAMPADLQPHAAEVKEALGDEVIFSQTDERNFIAAADVPEILQDMHDRVLALAPGYFGHPDFAARFIRRKWRQYRERPPSQWAPSAKSPSS